MGRAGLLCVAVLAAWLGGCGGSASHKTASTRTKRCVATIVGVDVHGTGPVPPEKLVGSTGRCAKPIAVTVPPNASPQVEDAAGKTLVGVSGCLACHMIGENGNRGPGENLSSVGSVLSRAQIERALIDPKAPMPSFKNLGAAKLEALVSYLATLRR